MSRRGRTALRAPAISHLDYRQRRTDGHHITRFARQLQHHAGHRRGHFHRGLVGHHVGQWGVFLYRIAHGDVPGDDLGRGDALADVGQAEGEAGHRQPLMIWRSASPMRTGPGK